MQQRFLAKMGLRVDFPSTKGTGNSNNGNVCRTAFSKPDDLADILELDKYLIQRVRIILIALSCQLPLDADRFHDYCMETARHYTRLYEWFPLPPTIHKVFMHSRDIMLANELPVGVLGEDAAESSNKYYRHNRQFHARKDSRENNLKDIFQRALDSSDPLVAGCSAQKRLNSRSRKALPTEVLDLLKDAEIPDTTAGLELMEQVEEEETDDFDGLEEFSKYLDNLVLPDDSFYCYDDSED